MYIVFRNVKDTYASFAARNFEGRIFPTIYNSYIIIAVTKIPLHKDCYKKRSKLVFLKGVF